MEETVSVLIWECWLWEDTMDMTDWARLLLAGSVETGVEGRRLEVRHGFWELTEEPSSLPVLAKPAGTTVASPHPCPQRYRFQVFRGSAPSHFRAQNSTQGTRIRLSLTQRPRSS